MCLSILLNVCVWSPIIYSSCGWRPNWLMADDCPAVWPVRTNAVRSACNHWYKCEEAIDSILYYSWLLFWEAVIWLFWWYLVHFLGWEADMPLNEAVGNAWLGINGYDIRTKWPLLWKYNEADMKMQSVDWCVADYYSVVMMTSLVKVIQSVLTDIGNLKNDSM